MNWYFITILQPAIFKQDMKWHMIYLKINHNQFPKGWKVALLENALGEVHFPKNIFGFLVFASTNTETRWAHWSENASRYEQRVPIIFGLVCIIDLHIYAQEN